MHASTSLTGITGNLTRYGTHIILFVLTSVCKYLAKKNTLYKFKGFLNPFPAFKYLIGEKLKNDKRTGPVFPKT